MQVEAEVGIEVKGVYETRQVRVRVSILVPHEPEHHSESQVRLRSYHPNEQKNWA